MSRRTLSFLLMLGFVAGCAEAQPAPVTESGPDPFEPIPFPSPNTPPVQKDKDEFSTTDRAQGERYLAGLHTRFQELARQPNAAVQMDLLADLKKAVAAIDGKVVTWEARTRFSADGRSIVVDLPGVREGRSYQLATTNYGETPNDEQTAVQLRLGRELDRDQYRQLKGGERVKFKAMVTATITQFGLSIILVGRIVEDPFGRPVKYEAFQAGATWGGLCTVTPNQNVAIPIPEKYSLKIKVTDRQKDSFTGTCTDMKSLFGNHSYAVTGKIDGDKVEMTIHRGKEREQFPYFTTFKGTLTDGFVMKGTFDKGTCLFSLMD